MIIISDEQNSIRIFDVIKGNACMPCIHRIRARRIDKHDTLSSQGAIIIELDLAHEAGLRLLRYIALVLRKTD
ncbi:hypothetical protein D3C78_1449780 [compost metagenome]